MKLNFLEIDTEHRTRFYLVWEFIYSVIKFLSKAHVKSLSEEYYAAIHHTKSIVQSPVGAIRKARVSRDMQAVLEFFVFDSDGLASRCCRNGLFRQLSSYVDGFDIVQST